MTAPRATTHSTVNLLPALCLQVLEGLLQLEEDCQLADEQQPQHGRHDAGQPLDDLDLDLLLWLAMRPMVVCPHVLPLRVKSQSGGSVGLCQFGLVQAGPHFRSDVEPVSDHLGLLAMSRTLYSRTLLGCLEGRLSHHGSVCIESS